MRVLSLLTAAGTNELASFSGLPSAVTSKEVSSASLLRATDLVCVIALPADPPQCGVVGIANCDDFPGVFGELCPVRSDATAAVAAATASANATITATAIAL